MAKNFEIQFMFKRIGFYNENLNIRGQLKKKKLFLYQTISIPLSRYTDCFIISSQCANF